MQTKINNHFEHLSPRCSYNSELLISYKDVYLTMPVYDLDLKLFHPTHNLALGSSRLKKLSQIWIGHILGMEVLITAFSQKLINSPVLFASNGFDKIIIHKIRQKDGMPEAG